MTESQHAQGFYLLQQTRLQNDMRDNRRAYKFASRYVHQATLTCQLLSKYNSSESNLNKCRANIQTHQDFINTLNLEYSNLQSEMAQILNNPISQTTEIDTAYDAAYAPTIQTVQNNNPGLFRRLCLAIMTR